MIGIIYADTLKDLQTKSIGYNHDHCEKLYFGRIDEIQDKKLISMVKEDKMFCLIYKEDPLPK